MLKTNTKTLKNKFCEKPFTDFILFEGPDFKANCCCWLMSPLGSVKHDGGFNKIWNGDEAKKFRQSIHDGTFKYCWDQCPHIQADDLPDRDSIQDPWLREVIDKEIVDINRPPALIQLNLDKSCNLSCPSCRTEKQMFSNGQTYEDMVEIMDQLSATQLDQLKTINITGSGDPFASKIYRNFLLNLDGAQYPDLKINLFTNGVLFTPEMWTKMKKVQKNISAVQVSMDAATEETYKVVRRGGDFHKVLKNLEFLAELAKNKEIDYLGLFFVVQQRNYHEMAEFAQMACSIGHCYVFFQQMWNWGTFSNEEFKSHAIHETTNPEHQEFLDQLTNPIFQQEFVKMGNLTEFLPKPDQHLKDFHGRRTDQPTANP